jgi:4-hydroxy-tetrahydrodipicolinate reductase
MNPKVMVNGMPGNMGLEVGMAVLRQGLELLPWSLTAEQTEDPSCLIGDKKINLVRPSQREEVLLEIVQKFGSFISVDYTHPSAVNQNAAFYAKHGLPFVMGTTGGDRVELEKTVDQAGVYCVIAPNMAKQVVAFQAMMEYMASQFPGVFSGYHLHVVESHQKTKADTSGTAKAVVASFNKMGLNEGVEQIEMVRQEADQVEKMKVPTSFLNGHAFHTYNLDSADGSVHFEFQHNICGRRIYAEGSVDAVRFLAKKILDQSQIKRFNMIDVLRSGMS